EPTTGLHFDDVRKLLEVLHRLADLGNSVIIIEHNLDVIRNADWILDLGPEGGEDGGHAVGEGRPAKIAATPGSFTGQFLKRYYTSSNGHLEQVDLDDDLTAGDSATDAGAPEPVLSLPKDPASETWDGTALSNGSNPKPKKSAKRASAAKTPAASSSAAKPAVA